MITRKDIADRLGVSVSVVSRALNNSGYVERQKKDQIIALAKELGYTREPAAIRADHPQSHMLLFYLKDTRNSFYLELYEGLVEASNERGYGVFLYRSNSFEQIPQMAVDGIVFPNESLAVDYLKTVGRKYYLPAVSCSYGYNYLLPRGIPQIDCDVLQGTMMLVDHLRKNGHKRIAMISPEDISQFGVRLISWQSAMVPVVGDRVSEYMFTIDEVSKEESSSGGYDGNWFCDYFERGSIGAKRFIESGCDATAMICFNEEVALGFCKALEKMHVRIPEDLSVVTYDATFLSRYFTVPLTKINLHPHLQGRMCAKTLIDLIDGIHPERVQHVPIELVEGESVRSIIEN